MTSFSTCAPALPHLPILILANRTRSEDRVRVLDLGADDLVRKPFAFPELSAHVRALLRRGRSLETVLRIEDLELDRVEHAVRRAGRIIELTPKEFALLEYLMRNACQPITRSQIIEHVWNLSFDTMTNGVDVYINYLRKKVDAFRTASSSTPSAASVTKFKDAMARAKRANFSPRRCGPCGPDNAGCERNGAAANSKKRRTAAAESPPNSRSIAFASVRNERAKET